jgi:hypothetical protein
MEYLIDEDTFERLELGERNSQMARADAALAYLEDSEGSVSAAGSRSSTWTSYHEFVEWNKECLQTMSETDRALIRLLCGRIKSRTLLMVDADCGATTSVVEFYIDSRKRLCLVNSR